MTAFDSHEKTTTLRPLRILVLCYEYPPVGGGGGVGAQMYAEAWAAAGNEVLVLTGEAPDRPADTVESGVRVVRVSTPGKKLRATASIPTMAAYLGSAMAWLTRNRNALGRFDVINTHFVVPTGPLGWWASRVLDLPNVLTIIGGDIYDPSKASSPHRHGVLRAMNRRLMNDADRVVAISTDTRGRAQELYSVTRSIEVIPYGFRPPDSDRQSAGRTDDEGFHLVAVGRLVKRKGFSFLIEAVSRLPDHVNLRLVGDGPLDAELRALARKTGVETRVEFLGFQNRRSILDLMADSDCFVLSSLHEGLGIVVQEAMFSGLPIVATDEGGQVDLVSDGEGGFLVSPGDSGALAAAVKRVMTEPGLAESFGSRNQARISQLSGEAMSGEYIALFRDLLRERISAATTQSLPR